jgi:hypothetical protein
MHTEKTARDGSVVSILDWLIEQGSELAAWFGGWFPID